MVEMPGIEPGSDASYKADTTSFLRVLCTTLLSRLVLAYSKPTYGLQPDAPAYHLKPARSSQPSGFAPLLARDSWVVGSQTLVTGS